MFGCFATVIVMSEGTKAGSARLDSYFFFSPFVPTVEGQETVSLQSALFFLVPDADNTDSSVRHMSYSCLPILQFYCLLLYILLCCIATFAVYLVHDIDYMN